MLLIQLCVIFAAICVVQSFFCKNGLNLINSDFVTEEDKQTILDTHNDVRHWVNKGRNFGQPKPRSPLQDLQWDDHLAQLAMEMATICELKILNQTSTKYDCIGQNVWAQMSNNINSTIDWQLPVDAWAAFVHSYQYPFTSKDGKEFGQYTQMVWSNTMYIGCADVEFQKSTNLYGYLYVCNYGPCGNHVNTPPYEV